MDVPNGRREIETIALEQTAARNDTAYYLAGEGLLGAIRNGEEGTYTAEFSTTDAGTAEIDSVSLFFEYPAGDGETYTFNGREIAVRQETVTVPAGTFEGAYTYSYEDFEEPIETTFAPGVSLIRVEAGGSPSVELASYDLQSE